MKRKHTAERNRAEELAEATRNMRLVGMQGAKAVHSVPASTVMARLAEIPADTRSKTARLCGDPLPGRSALDRRGY